MRFRLAAITALSFVVIGAGCDRAAPAATTGHEHHEASDAPAAVEAVEDAERFSWDALGGIKVGQEKLISLLIKKPDGGVYAPGELKIVHEKKFHLLVVRDDMTGYKHAHPEYIEKEKVWKVPLTFPEAGAYHLYADIAPEGEAPAVYRLKLQVEGPTADPHPPISDEPLFTVSGYDRVELAFDELPSPGKPARLDYKLQSWGKPSKDIRPYLGAYGHAVALKHGEPDVFIHAHPAAGAPKNGEIGFETVFPTPGRYTIYAQFNIAGKLGTFPYTVDVE